MFDVWNILCGGGKMRTEKSRHSDVPAFVFGSLNMAVIADMFLAIAIVALATGAIPEFQFRIADICSAADGAAVGIGGFGCGFCGFVGASIKGDNFRPFLLNRLFLKKSSSVDPPAHGDYIQHIFAEEQEIVGQGNHGEQIVGEWIGDQIQNDDGQIHQSKDPCFYGNDEKQQELSIREQGGIAEDQA